MTSDGRGIILTGCLVALTTACGGPGLDELTLWSPQRTYQVRLSGDFGKPVRPFTTYNTSFEAFVEGRPYVGPLGIHESDALDTAFQERYTSQVWPSENVIQFKSGRAESDVLDNLVVKNQSGKILRHLIVRSEDLLVLLDVKPEAVTKVIVTGQRRTNSLWLAAQGALVEGPVLKYYGANFEPANPQPPSGEKYTLVVTVELDRISLAITLPDGSSAIMRNETNRR